MICRICSAANARALEEVAFFEDFSTTIYDCPACGSRFAPSAPDLYESFHANAAHYYVLRMRAWNARARALIDQGDTAGLRRAAAGFHFAMPQIIDTLNMANARSVLEAGCAWGYNGAYFIQTGHDYLGVDISQTAVDQARGTFGDRFCTVDDPRYAAHTPFDAAFHLGTIGCVEKPIEFTHQILDAVKPGGVLMFNAPCLEQCAQLDSPWIWGACPPDLVTLFSEDFWHKTFSDVAHVETKLIWSTPVQSARLRLARRKSRQPYRGRILEPVGGHSFAAGSRAKAVLRHVAQVLPVPFVAPVVNAFGVIVTMTKRPETCRV